MFNSESHPNIYVHYRSEGFFYLTIFNQQGWIKFTKSDRKGTISSKKEKCNLIINAGLLNFLFIKESVYNIDTNTKYFLSIKSAY